MKLKKILPLFFVGVDLIWYLASGDTLHWWWAKITVAGGNSDWNLRLWAFLHFPASLVDAFLSFSNQVEIRDDAFFWNLKERTWDYFLQYFPVIICFAQTFFVFRWLGGRLDGKAAKRSSET
jgi:hypothetical protein